MIEFEYNKQLQPYNTFGIATTAQYFTSIRSIDDILQVFNNQLFNRNFFLILGGGSNFLFCNNIPGTVLKIEIPGMQIIEETTEHAIVKAGAGVEWDSFVEWSVNNNLSGLENLSYIPGTVGACPVQNIGAYGVEVKDTVVDVECFDIQENKLIHLTNNNCEFGYRTSIFKTTHKNKYIITSVAFKLSKKPQYKIEYGSIAEELAKLGETNIQTIRQAVINIRRAKLPDPEDIGNAGSFFKNPVIDSELAAKLKVSHPNLPVYDFSEQQKKIAAAFLIEQCGWKGFRNGDAGVHQNQPLVLVNYGKATGNEILKLAQDIQKSVFEKFGVTLEMEVNTV